MYTILNLVPRVSHLNAWGEREETGSLLAPSGGREEERPWERGCTILGVTAKCNRLSLYQAKTHRTQIFGYVAVRFVSSYHLTSPDVVHHQPQKVFANWVVRTLSVFFPISIVIPDHLMQNIIILGKTT